MQVRSRCAGLPLQVRMVAHARMYCILLIISEISGRSMVKAQTMGRLVAYRCIALTERVKEKL